MNKPCKLTFLGVRYYIKEDGSVVRLSDCLVMPTYAAAQIKAEARRLRHNRNRRERDQVMRDLGLVKTPYGWE